jgi:predicted lipoprotein with Yx(FWY)xxD motif
MRRTLIAVVLASSVTLAVAASGFAAAKTATVKTRHGKLGTYLVDSKGRSLYLFKKDKTTKSTCYDACATAWPPLLTSGKPKAAGNAKASLLSTTKRRDGTRQVTYKGHPLYYFIQDKKAGDTKGQDVDGFGAQWYVLAPSGSAILGDG